jgi:glutathione synthase/RimK-type ligase-like ATP-grasp enzyme
MDMAGRCGFSVPRSLVTNEAQEAIAFVRENGSAVVKQISSGHPRECADRLPFAAKVDLDDIRRFEANIRSSPTLFQVVVDKVIELRIYVIENHVFCAGMRIGASDHVDARSLIIDKHYFRFALDADTIGKVRKLVAALDLRYAAIDMAIDSGGNLVFFEANHSGQWGYVEKETGHPITQSIAEELVSHART